MDEELRVLELGRGTASAYAAKLLGDHGADVIKVEPPEGDRARLRGPFRGRSSDAEQSGNFLALNVNKRGVTLPLEDDQHIASLLAWADVLVHDFPAVQALGRRLDAASIGQDYPHLVTLAITPFGHSGPYAHFHAEELTVANAGGWANLCPATHTDMALPPLKVFGDQCALMSAVAGAMSALAFARDARQSGAGEYIDFSEQEYIASVLEIGIPAFSYKGEVATRHHQRSLIPWRTFRAKDMPVFMVCVEQDQWERLVAFMGNPEWATLDLLSDQPGRAENQDLVHTMVQEFVSEWNAMDLYHAAQEHRICVAPVLGFAEIHGSEHLRAREFFVDVARDAQGSVEYLAPAVVTTNGRAPIRRPAPRLGEHNSELASLAAPRLRATSSLTSGKTAPRVEQLPLSGVRVLDLTWAWAGPFCSMNLAHLGAQVIRVESAKRADLYRRLPVYPDDWQPGLNISGMFNQWNQGKSSMSIDLATPEGLQIVKDLVKQSDVVVQNFATGVMERLGLGYSALRDINPAIILASISGYGQTGPYSRYMGYGPAIPPLTGLSAATGYLGGEPEEMGLSMPDPTAGITAAMAIVSALVKRDDTGQGDHLDVTLWEATGVLNFAGWMDYVFNGQEPERLGNRSRLMSPHGCFPCESERPEVADAGDSGWISIACRNDTEWQHLAGLMSGSLVDDPRFASLHARKENEDALEQVVGDWTRERNRWEITRELQAVGIPAFPTLTIRDIVEDPHLNARGFIERLEHPEVGVRAHAGIPWRLHRRGNGVGKAAPCLGADTDRHLREILSLDEAAIAGLYARKVIGV